MLKRLCGRWWTNRHESDVRYRLVWLILMLAAIGIWYWYSTLTIPEEVPSRSLKI